MLIRGVGRGGGAVKTPPQLRSSAVFHISLPFRILKMIATSGFLTAIECTKFDFGRGSVPDPAGGAYSAPPAQVDVSENAARCVFDGVLQNTL